MVTPRFCVLHDRDTHRAETSPASTRSTPNAQGMTGSLTHRQQPSVALLGVLPRLRAQLDETWKASLQ